MKQRAVVTGLGVISPVGHDPDEMWSNLIAGRSGVGYISKFDTSEHAVKIAAEVQGFDPVKYIDRKEARRMDPCCQYALAAALEAVEDSGLDLDKVSPERIGVVLGTGQGGITTLFEQMEIYFTRGPRRVSPFCVPMMISNMPAGHVAIRFGARGPNITLTTACAASGHALGEALRILQRGEADMVLAGGTESGIVPISLAGFASMKALSTRNDDPTGACRPFDVERDGFVLGEGAAVMVLETLEHAESRGADILAELVGYAASSDAYHITAPPPSGEGGARSMAGAIIDAGLQPAEIDYINAHGTGTPTGDPAEAMAIKSALGELAPQVPVTSTKGLTGHLLGAAGALESAICIKSILEGMILPTANLDQPEEGWDLDFVPGKPRKARVDVALSNSFGFGGQNATLIWRRYE